MRINPKLNSPRRSTIFHERKFGAKANVARRPIVEAPINSSRSIIFSKNANDSITRTLPPPASLPFPPLFRPPSLSVSLSRSLSRLFFFQGKNFSIFTTLPSGCPAYRYSISSGIERPTYGSGDRGNAGGNDEGGRVEKKASVHHRAIRLKDVTRPSFNLYRVDLTFVIVIISSPLPPPPRRRVLGAGVVSWVLTFVPPPPPRVYRIETHRARGEKCINHDAFM